MAMARFEIVERQPFEHESFDQPYERIDAVAHYAVDPTAPANASIVDLALAPRDEAGLVPFNGDVTILRPLDGGRRMALVEVPNRGRRTSMSTFNRAPAVLQPTAEIDPGDGFLMRHGFTVVWCGWQWDVPRSPARMGLTPPMVDEQAELQLRLQLHERHETVDLTDHHVGVVGGHDPIPTIDVDDDTAVLLVRDGVWGEATVVDRSRWRFPDATHISLDGGFETGRIYDLIYRTPTIPVGGAGLLAVRDFGRFLRTGTGTGTGTSDVTAADLGLAIDHTLVTGQSQCGRFLRSFLHLGMNKGEDGQPAYDGVMAHIAGGRRGEFNHRLGQPSVQPTPSFGHLFPFADEPQTDPRTGRTAGLLDAQRELGAMPKVIYSNTGAEYWRGDASLSHTSVVDGSDVDPPDDTRHYMLSSTQHGAGALPLMDESPFGSSGANHFNIVDHTPLLRAIVMNLAAWVSDDVAPPPNAVPRLDDGTAALRADVLRQHRPEVAKADPDKLNTVRPLDLGPRVDEGIGRYPAQPMGDPYPAVVSAVDADGNEIAGIPMPDVTSPIATHTGWNPRRADTGGAGEILEYLGSTVPFSPDEIATRYADEAGYLALIEQNAKELVARRHLLPEDVATCIRIAAKRYQALVGHKESAAGGRQ